MTEIKSRANLDIQLLADALLAQTRRLERFMREAEMPEPWIRASTEYEYSLANRVLLGMEAKCPESR